MKTNASAGRSGSSLAAWALLSATLSSFAATAQSRPATPPPASESAPAAADSEDAPSNGDLLIGLLPEMHAFLSQGYIKSTGNNYLTNSKHGSFAFSFAAVNFTKQLTDRLRMGLQLYAQDLGAQPHNYDVNVDWLYLDYHFEDWLGARAGRTKVPFGLYNEINEIDAARVPVLLPQSVYPILDRTILLAQTGVELYGYVRLGAFGALDYRLYGGTLHSDTPAPPPGYKVTEYTVQYIYGGRLLWETPLEGLRAGGSVMTLRATETVVSLTSPTSYLSAQLPFVLAVASAEYNAHDLLLAAEYSRWTSDLEPSYAPPVRQVNERYYGMASVRVNSWFSPGAYYSVFVPNIDHRSGTGDFQNDLAATLRFDLNAHWLFKLEGHYIHGTADLTSDLNGDVPISSLARDWAAFFAQTTVYF